jgi:aspartyl-tRNA synthetase
MLRTHTCGQLTENDVGKEVTLCGWVHSRRDHGKLIFIDIRDRYGLTQVVFLPKPKELNEQAKKLRSEDVIKIKGQVNKRPAGTENAKIPTGMVEIVAAELEIINASIDLPFVVDDMTEVSEEVRLTYRYLDLRRPRSREKIVLRHKIIQAFRRFLDAEDFLEIETPFLTKSTPEGARDFLVPSRLSPGNFYALPQSPQLFKQILMVSGMDRYYQVARCFRDEDMRKDRQPEFTQLDIEMSFVDQEDILSLVERMIAYVFKQALNIDIPIPFKSISHQEAMEKYKSDKPDIGASAGQAGGQDFRFAWVMDFPLFEYNDEEKRWQACHHPFTSPKLEDLALLDSGELGKIKARAYDLILNGTEVAGGSIRIHSCDLQTKIFKVLGISDENAQSKFGFLLDAFKYGAPPHGGIAFGLDRLCAIVAGCDSIRDVIAFPKTQKGTCLLSGAPSMPEPKQLKEAWIKVIEQPK